MKNEDLKRFLVTYDFKTGGHIKEYQHIVLFKKRRDVIDTFKTWKTQLKRFNKNMGYSWLDFGHQAVKLKKIIEL